MTISTTIENGPGNHVDGSHAGKVALVTGGALTAGRMPVRARAWLPVVLTATHLSWGTGFLVGRPRS